MCIQAAAWQAATNPGITPHRKIHAEGWPEEQSFALFSRKWLQPWSNLPAVCIAGAAQGLGKAPRAEEHSTRKEHSEERAGRLPPLLEGRDLCGFRLQDLIGQVDVLGLAQQRVDGLDLLVKPGHERPRVLLGHGRLVLLHLGLAERAAERSWNDTRCSVLWGKQQQARLLEQPSQQQCLAAPLAGC